MLAGCSRVPFCQGTKSLPINITGVYHPAQGHALRQYELGSAVRCVAATAACYQVHVVPHPAADVMRHFAHVIAV